MQFGDPVKPDNVKGGFGFKDNGVEEKNLYFYHPDHLGSSSYITDRIGKVTQHTEYIAFGEVLFDEHTTETNMPYLFNGKELDQETGLYYYGARYYDARVSLWLNVDPLAEKYPFTSPYTYTNNNPIRFIDPDGRKNYDITFGKSVSANTQNQIVSDLEKETGLKLSVGSDGKLSYTETENMGGSKIARDMLKGAIDNHRTDYQINSDNTRGSSIQEIQGRGEIIDGKAGYTHVYDLNINTDQIDSFIAGTSQSLNPLTMGYGMVTLHEVSHKYNNLDDQNIIANLPGPNVSFINTIRKELDDSGNFKLPFGQRVQYSPGTILHDKKTYNFHPFQKFPKDDFGKFNKKNDKYILTPRK